MYSKYNAFMYLPPILLAELAKKVAEELIAKKMDSIQKQNSLFLRRYNYMCIG